MKNGNIKLGPLALLLAVISICLTTLAILSFSTARADRRLAEKYAQTVSVRYALEERGQELLSQLDEGTDGWEQDENGRLWYTLEQDGARLRIALEPTESGEYAVAAWIQDREWKQDTHIENLWSGNEFGRN